MRLFAAEWSRLFARRFTRVMFLIVVLLLGLIGAGIAASSHVPSASDQAKARVEADRQRAFVVERRARCENPSAAQPGEEPAPSPPPGLTCAETFDPSEISDASFLPATFSFGREAHDMVLIFGGLFALLAFAVGASFVGAEWASGSMMNLLIWRPRRILVLLTKLFTLLFGLAVTGALVAVAWIGAAWLIGRYRGQVGTVTQGSLTSLGLDTARALALGLAMAAIGFALASLGRHTAMALGAAVAYMLVIEVGLNIVLRLTEVSKVERWFLSSYAIAWLEQKSEFVDFTPCRYAEGPCEPLHWSIGMADSAVIFGVGATALVALAVIVMRRRDVA
jgi:ABC-2 type transport system permease protein